MPKEKKENFLEAMKRRLWKSDKKSGDVPVDQDKAKRFMDAFKKTK